MNEGKKPIKFSIGYQLQEEENEESFVDIAGDFKDHIGEIYFPWANMPSGRAPLLDRGGYVAWDGQQKLENDLAAFRSMGIKLNLLFNANCYGKYALSQYLRNRVVSVLDYLQDKVGGVDIVTTSSLTIAGVIKKYAPAVDVRASVNMRIGTPRGMEYVSGVFDSYYVQREYNRNMEHLKMLRKWADARGKKLYLLVNSGCLNFCSGQTFHDNAVAHEQELSLIHI